MASVLFVRYERTNAEYVEKLPSGKHCCKGTVIFAHIYYLCNLSLSNMPYSRLNSYYLGLGSTIPDPKGNVTLDDGVVVPMGKPVSAGLARSSLLYNE